MEYWAHSSRGLTGGVQLLSEHLSNVGTLCRRLAQDTRPTDTNFASVAEWAGAFHDLGKYQERFQRRIRGAAVRCPHAIHGASYLCLGDLPLPNPLAACLAEWTIAGHHAGLTDAFTKDEFSVFFRTNKFRQEALALSKIARHDSPYLSGLLQQSFPGLRQEDVPVLDLRTRMLFSCLIDADRLDSSGRSWQPTSLDASQKVSLLQAEIERLSQRESPAEVKRARELVEQNCVRAASADAMLFSLSVPTGGGKTLASMAFALQRAVLLEPQYRRVIVVIPYLSIIEQTVDIYRRVFGESAVLEHHSGAAIPLQRARSDGDEIYVAARVSEDAGEANEPEPSRDDTENWDAPFVVTTSVRFFESLFSNRPSDLRRIHNIARSIIVLDEVQTLPRNLLAPLLNVIEELSRDWGCTFVFSTATLPAFEQSGRAAHDVRLPRGSVREIIEQPQELRSLLKRVQIEWRLDKPSSWPELAAEILSNPQALCIVNLRDHASVLYDEVLNQAREQGISSEGIFHLSTRMCAAHRLRVLDQIRQRLCNHESCRVISTQLVEAGVDIDFPLVLRALAPLDSVIQAAGRADREGLITARLGHPGGRVIVFRTEDGKVPPGAYREATSIADCLAQDLSAQGKSIQVDSVEALSAYYERYYGDADVGESLQELRDPRKLAFATLAANFEMIGNRTRDVYVPDNDEASHLLDELRDKRFLAPELRRALQRHSVGLQPYEFEKAKTVLSQLRDTEIWIAGEGSYDPIKGLKFEWNPADLMA